MKPKSLTYKDVGVDIDRGNAAVKKIQPLAQSTRRPEVISGIGGFSGAFRMEEPGTIVAGADGVGSKLLVAERLNRHDTVGIDLVAMNVNDVLASGAEPLFFLDYIGIGRLDPERVAEIVEGVAEGCRQAGCALLGGETAEMPEMYPGQTYDLAGFVVGRQVLDAQPVVSGDRILGLFSSGFHSNGYALIRRIFDPNRWDWHKTYPETGDKTLGDVLLTPTRIYVKPVMSLWKTVSVKAMAHITGGGLMENVGRTLPQGLRARLDQERWEVPPMFRWLEELGPVPRSDMYRTVNMGIGFTVVVSPEEVEPALQHLHDQGVAAAEIGEITEGSGVEIQ